MGWRRLHACTADSHSLAGRGARFLGGLVAGMGGELNVVSTFFFRITVQLLFERSSSYCFVVPPETRHPLVP